MACNPVGSLHGIHIITTSSGAPWSFHPLEKQGSEGL